MKIFIIAAMVLLIGVAGVSALTSDDPCVETESLTIGVGFEPGANATAFNNVRISGNCSQQSIAQAEVFWPQLNPILGPIEPGEVVILPTSVYVDADVRPDLDVPAKLTFRYVPFAFEPQLLKDGVPCDAALNCTNKTYDVETSTLSVNVGGFSNYSLTGRTDFNVYSDPEPELKGRVYQTIDLGDANRGIEFACLVQIYGRNENGQWILVQTNPRRDVAAKPFGNPDPNLPESLGYFKTVNGVANVYFVGDLPGYIEFAKVTVCTNTTSMLVHEENINTRYVPVGRSMVGRGMWFVSGENLPFLIIGIIIVLIALMLFIKIVRMMRGK